MLESFEYSSRGCHSDATSFRVKERAEMEWRQLGRRGKFVFVSLWRPPVKYMYTKKQTTKTTKQGLHRTVTSISTCAFIVSRREKWAEWESAHAKCTIYVIVQVFLNLDNRRIRLSGSADGQQWPAVNSRKSWHRNLKKKSLLFRILFSSCISGVL